MKYLKVGDQVWNIIRECACTVMKISRYNFIAIEYSDGSIDDHVYNAASKFLVKMTDKEQVITFDIPAIERDVPADGTPVWVWDMDYKKGLIRISTGNYNENGLLSVYLKGHNYGGATVYDNWELVTVNPALSSDHKDVS